MFQNGEFLMRCRNTHYHFNVTAWIHLHFDVNILIKAYANSNKVFLRCIKYEALTENCPVLLSCNLTTKTSILQPILPNVGLIYLTKIYSYMYQSPNSDNEILRLFCSRQIFHSRTCKLAFKLKKRQLKLKLIQNA